MEMMMPNQNMYQGYMHHQQHYNLPQQQQHFNYYDNQSVQDQYMMYQSKAMDTGYSHEEDMMMTKGYCRSDSVQLLRCRRRVDLARLQETFKTHPTAVARRNERERNRVKHINSTFANLRQHLPTSGKAKKLSKVDTLRSAIRYIKHLQKILQETQCDDVTTTTSQGPPMSPGELSVKSEPATPSTCRTDSPLFGSLQSLQCGSSPEQNLMSPIGRDALSPSAETASQGSPSCQRSASPYASDDASYDVLESAADDLSDLVHWLQ